MKPTQENIPDFFADFKQAHDLSLVLSAIPVGAVVVDKNLIIRAFNPTAAQITGIKREDALGQPYAHVLQTERQTITDPLEEAIATGQKFVNQRFYLTSHDNAGPSRPIRHSASLLTNEEGEVVGGVTIFADISRQVELERSLKSKQRHLSQVLELAPYGIVTVDADLSIATFNRAAETLTGYAASFAAEKMYREILNFDPDLPDPFLELRQVEENDVLDSARTALLNAGGERFPVRYNIAPLYDDEERFQGGIFVFDDISDIVAAERTKNEFISMVSHELRTPMTSIKGFVTAVLEGRAGPVTEKQKRFLQISREQSDLLLNLINDLLSLTRLETDNIELNFTRLVVGDLLQQAANAMLPLAGRKEIDLTVHAPDSLPRLWGDEEKLYQVCQNLCANAIKFTPRQGKVTLEAYQENENTLALKVTDTGVGIEKGELAHIFKPFYQVENIQTRHVGGTGLGLPIVQRIVEAHGGIVHVESQEGAGATFTVLLPIQKNENLLLSRKPDEEREPAPEAPAVAPTPPQRLVPLILVVDDKPSVGLLIQVTLEEEGWQVIRAQSGVEALALAAEHQPDLITLDILMPEMDGFNVLDLLKQNPQTRHIPACIVSIVEDKARGYRLGAIDYISKPFESDQLVGMVNNILETKPGTQPDNKILVVEDDPNVMELIELALSSESYEVISAYDGIGGLEKLRRERPSLVLLDIMIPKLDGYDFIRQAKADARTEEIPIIVLSVRALEEDITRALRLGAERYLTKPTNLDKNLHQTLPQIVKDVLDNE